MLKTYSDVIPYNRQLPTINRYNGTSIHRHTEKSELLAAGPAKTRRPNRVTKHAQNHTADHSALEKTSEKLEAT